MNKKIKQIIFLVIVSSVFLAGCMSPTAKTNGNGQKNTKPANITENQSRVTSDAIDYNQYIKKTWLEKKGTNGIWSFCITKIENKEITARFNWGMPAVPNDYDLGHLTGIINKDTAECQFSDNVGNKGIIKLVFKPNNEIEGTLKLTDKTQQIEEQPREGTFQFAPYNVNNIEGFSLIKDQSFMVDLNSWGNVKFVSGKATGGMHIPTVFFLTDKVGDILYDFDSDLPYSVDVKAVSFQDVNKDGLKDVIIIAQDNYNGPGEHIATFYLQKSDGSFATNPTLRQELNDSGNNKDIKSVTNFLSQKF